jgi:hypothetical protein
MIGLASIAVNIMLSVFSIQILMGSYAISRQYL